MARIVHDTNWIVTEDKIDPERMRFYETLFTLGNGYVGSRGILEEGYEQGHKGTYFAGVYDKERGKSFEIVNAPNPISLEAYVGDRKLSAHTMEILEHRRILNLKRALLIRRTVFVYGDRRYEYESRRFFSAKYIHLAVMIFSFRSLDTDENVAVRYIIDGGSRNEVQPGGGKPVKHYEIKRKFERDGKLYLEAKTKESGISIGMAGLIAARGIPSPDVRATSQGESIDKELCFLAKKGKRYTFHTYISLYTSREANDVENSCFTELESARRVGVTALLQGHVNEWEGRWETCDIRIKGDPSNQLALRFNTYHLLIAAPPDGVDASIPAKALSGEWYKGHIFWDTEIYVLPFFAYMQPETARNMLLYRARRIEGAKEGAKAQGYKGTLWPWESGPIGKDETPDRWTDFDGATIPVYNRVKEHHIAGDVIYAVALYYLVSNDERFMLAYGLEMVFETARFWASRVHYDKEKEKYEIRNVIGPNEFQQCVNNNSYTNYLAQWLLDYAFRLYYGFKKSHAGGVRDLEKRIRLREKEANRWKEISENMLFLQRKDGLIEEFEGYFKKRDVTIRKFMANGLPVWPSNVKLSEVRDTQLVKQADVILLLDLFSPKFSQSQKKANLEYYGKRTTHKSSLSIPSYAKLWLEVGRTRSAYQYFTIAVNSDLKNVYGNTEQGIHAASLGGAWQIVVNGFCGLRTEDDMLSISPRLPEKWKEVRFRIWFRKALLEIAITRGKTAVSVVKDEAETKGGIDMRAIGKKKYLISKGNVSAQ